MDDHPDDKTHHRPGMSDSDRAPDPLPARSPGPRRRYPFFRTLGTALGWIFRLVAALVIILDELVRPIYRPLLARLAALGIMQAFERWIGKLPALAVLILLLVPYAIVEPLKFLGLVWAADGWPKRGTALFLIAHLVSFVLIERVFTAGRPQLMTIRWMAWVIDTANAVRRRIVVALRLEAAKRWIRRAFRRLRAELRGL
ncbi:hypothetical protein Snov_3759 [Ancylobacter novellus DSM 506]|uniref:Transmembrane protein n=2 Tax=Ancylobacter novellus TaxID=921 RepID=D6ZYR0_ANCN5|nr:hypothetical protein Snov_3759 [Ancylobacter novellus DSM 506]